MNKALLIDHSTGDVSVVTIDGTVGVRELLDGYIRGKTIAELGGAFLRKWSSCERPAFLKPSGLEVVDAYDAITLEPVDIPVTAEEYKRSIGSTFNQPKPKT